MSKIAFTPNASGTGTFTIASPNSNSDRTLTLPDATGTVNVSGLANEVPAGSAGAPAIYPTGDSNTGIFFPAADTIAFSEGGVESMRITSSGNVGIGTSSPTPLGTGITTLELKGNSASQTDRAGGINFMRYDGNPGMYVYHADDASYISSLSTYPLLIQTNGTERARIDSDGTLLIGRTSDVSAATRLGLDATASISGFVSETGPTTSVTHGRFYNGNGNVGNISTNGSATTYATSSDYRLKENVQPMQDALAVIAQLNPVTYTWKADGSDGQGFIAHELQTVVPDCVTGEKDAVDAEGNPQYQGVDTSFLVATLVKAVQELTARIAVLEAN